MNNSWIKTRLGDILEQVQRQTSLNPTATYNLLGVRLDGGGVFLRESKQGSTIAATTLNQVQAGDFIYSRLFAWRGAFGIITSEFDGCYVSNEFPTFLPQNDSIDIRFLNYWFRLPEVRRKVEADCSGSTPLTRNRFKEHFFLDLEIPLPPLSEQRRIVAKIERLAGNIEEAKRLRVSATESYENLCRSLIWSSNEKNYIPISELVEWRMPDTDVEPNKTYHFAGVYCFGRGVFAGVYKKGIEFSYKKLTQLKKDEFVYPKLMAWEGALGIVPPDCDGLYVSPEFPVFEIDKDKVLPEVLDVYFRSPSVWSTLSGESSGTNVRRRRLNPKTFLKYRFPLPPMHVQRKLREIRQKQSKVLSLHNTMIKELDALHFSILDKAFKGEL